MAKDQGDQIDVFDMENQKLNGVPHQDFNSVEDERRFEGIPIRASSCMTGGGMTGRDLLSTPMREFQDNQICTDSIDTYRDATLSTHRKLISGLRGYDNTTDGGSLEMDLQSSLENLQHHADYNDKIKQGEMLVFNSIED